MHFQKRLNVIIQLSSKHKLNPQAVIFEELHMVQILLTKTDLAKIIGVNPQEVSVYQNVYPSNMIDPFFKIYFSWSPWFKVDAARIWSWRRSQPWMLWLRLWCKVRQLPVLLCVMSRWLNETCLSGSSVLCWLTCEALWNLSGHLHDSSQSVNYNGIDRNNRQMTWLQHVGIGSRRNNDKSNKCGRDSQMYLLMWYESVRFIKI